MRLAASLLFLLFSPLAFANSPGAGEAQPTLQKAVDLLDPATVARVACEPAPSLGDADLSERIRNSARRDIDAYALKPDMLAARAEESMTALADPNAPDRKLLRRAYYADACERLNEKDLQEIEIKAALNRVAELFTASSSTLADEKASEAAAANSREAPPAAPEQEAEAPAPSEVVGNVAAAQGEVANRNEDAAAAIAAETQPAETQKLGQVAAAMTGQAAPPSADIAEEQREAAPTHTDDEADSAVAEAGSSAAAESTAPQAKARDSAADTAQVKNAEAAAPVISHLVVSDRNKNCELPARVAVPHIAESIRNRALADADTASDALSRLPALAQSSVDELAANFMTQREILSGGYYQELCRILGERGIAETEAASALHEVAAALNIAHLIPGGDADAPGVAGNAPAAPAEDAAASAGAEPEPAPSLQSAETETAAQEAPPSHDEPKIAAAEPSAPPAEAVSPSEAAPTPSATNNGATPPDSGSEVEVAEENTADGPTIAAAEQPSAADDRQMAETAPPETAPIVPETAPIIAPSAAPEPETAETATDNGQAAAPAPAVDAAPSAAPAAPAEAPPAVAMDAPRGGSRSNPGDADSAILSEEAAPATEAPSEAKPRTRAFHAAPKTQAPAEPSAPAASEPPAEADEPDIADVEEEAVEEPQPSSVRSAAEAPAEAEAEGTEAASQAGSAGGALGNAECRALGVLENCPDLNAVLGQLLEKPLEYNHPNEMLFGRNSEISLVLRTDWEGKDMPAEVSEEFKGLPGEVKQGISRITRVMSAELMGRDFEISPSGRQERTVILSQPVIWNWQVKPTETGLDKVLKLRLYAHLQGPGGTMPPILIKTLDANISVNVTTWDWLVTSAQMLEPIYAIAAALLGLLTAILTYFLSRRRAAFEGNPGSVTVRRSDDTISNHGPVIGDINQSVSDSRPSQVAAPKPSNPNALTVPPEGNATKAADPAPKPSAENEGSAPGASEDETKKE